MRGTAIIACVALGHAALALAFAPAAQPRVFRRLPSSRTVVVAMSGDDAAGGDPTEVTAEIVSSADGAAAAEDAKKVGNLVADDEYLGLSMELTELVRTAVIEDLKKKTRDFTGSDAYKVGDISKGARARAPPPQYL